MSQSAPAKRQGRAEARALRRHKILVAAVEVITSNPGFFTTNAVAAKSGVAIGSLYKLFRDRDDLLLALLGQEGATFTGSLRPEAIGETWPDPARNLTAALITYYRRRPRLAAELLLAEHRLQSRKPEGVLAITRKSLQAMLEAAPATGRNPNLSARSVAAMLCSMAVAASDREGRGDADAEEGMLAALAGYLNWFNGAPQRRTR